MRAIIASTLYLLTGATACAQLDFSEPAWSASFEATGLRSAALLSINEAMLAIALFEKGGLEALVIDTATGEVLDRSKAAASIQSVCARNGMIVLNGTGSEPPPRLTRPWADFVVKGSCAEGVDDAICQNERVLASHALPRGSEQLAICLPDGATQPVYHLIKADGASLKLGVHGPVPRRRGRYVLTETAQSGVFLSHHTVEIETTAVLIDVERGALTPVALPDLTDVIPSRGLGAGRTEAIVMLAANGAVLTLDRGAIVFVPHGHSAKTLKAQGVSSTALFNEGCGLALVSQDASGAASLEAFRICDDN